MVIFAGYILALLAILFLMNRAVWLQETELENKMIENYIESVKGLYVGLQERVEAVRRYRHDLAKHIRTLEMMMESQQASAQVQEYVDDLKAQYESLKRERYCSDEVLNAILAVKSEQCQNRKIPFAVEVENELYNGIQEVDLVCLLQNLLDNALEAQERILEGNDRGIHFSMGKEDDTVWITVENQIAPGEKIDFQTKKGNPQDHGIGTKIIDAMLKKYNGRKEISMDEQNCLFRKQIFMKECSHD